jgi:tetratricopeptide (TPR) repeat protein
LEEAVAAYCEVLKEQTRERAPLDWASTQTLLGGVLTTLGAGENNTARLEEAVAAYREALKELTRERAPPQWAAIQFGLGIALTTLGERENNTARLEEAVAAYREALKERTREGTSLDWAAVLQGLAEAQENLGYAQFVRGDFVAAALNLREAADGNAYPMLWLYLADTRSGGKNAKRDLQKGAESLRPEEWPSPVIEFFLGRRTPTAMLGAARAPNEQCEAQFYLGEWHLLRDKRADAIAALRKAMETCPADFNEYIGAAAELKRLESAR